MKQDTEALIERLREAAKCHFFGTWEGDAANEAADALEAAQKRIDELERALRLAVKDIEYAFDRFGFPRGKSSTLKVARTALTGGE